MLEFIALAIKGRDFPNAEWVSERTVTIPLSAKLTKEDVDRVIYEVKQCCIRVGPRAYPKTLLSY